MYSLAEINQADLTTLSINELILKYLATGRAAHFYPRLKLVSLNGGPRLPVSEAQSQMIEVLAPLAKVKLTKDLPATVKWFNDGKGYGFLSVNGLEVFAHYSEIQGEGFKTLAEGETVICNLLEGPKGPQALKIRKGSK